jgi:hypothetical protein
VKASFLFSFCAVTVICARTFHEVVRRKKKSRFFSLLHFIAELKDPDLKDPDLKALMQRCCAAGAQRRAVAASLRPREV